MEAIERMELYNTLFYVFLGVAVLGLVLTVLFFFRFRIPELFAIKTGRARKKTLEKMYEQSEKGDSIRQSKSSSPKRKIYSSSFGYTGEIGKTAALPNSSTAMETSVLTAGTNEADGFAEDTGMTAPLVRKKAPTGINFTVTEDTMLIHTQENI